jgi:hypothetical protein
MSLKVGNDRVRIDRFFAGPGARADQWSHLVELAQSWSRGSANRATVEVALNEMATAEEFHAYPGLKLISALRDAVAANDVQPLPDALPALFSRARFGRTPAIGTPMRTARLRETSRCILL